MSKSIYADLGVIRGIDFPMSRGSSGGHLALPKDTWKYNFPDVLILHVSLILRPCMGVVVSDGGHMVR